MFVTAHACVCACVLLCHTSGDITINMVGVPCVVMSALGGIMAIVLYYINDSAPTTPKKDTPDSENMGKTMWEIHESVAEGARTFLKTEYTYLAMAATCLFILVSTAVAWQTGICYLCGAFTSASCGYLGMCAQLQSSCVFVSLSFTACVLHLVAC